MWRRGTRRHWSPAASCKSATREGLPRRNCGFHSTSNPNAVHPAALTCRCTHSSHASSVTPHVTRTRLLRSPSTTTTISKSPSLLCWLCWPPLGRSGRRLEPKKMPSCNCSHGIKAYSGIRPPDTTTVLYTNTPWACENSECRGERGLGTRRTRTRPHTHTPCACARTHTDKDTHVL
jgi:hypothetical protein